jgi:cell division transport system permease protein
MPISFDYVARETGSNLWRNRLMTVAAILTVAVSLALVGAALLLKQGAAKAELDWQRGNQVVVWMQPTATQQEIRSVGTQLKTLPYVVQPCAYWNHSKDYAEAVRMEASTITEAGLKPADIPTSWRCTPTHPLDAQLVQRRFTGQPGVRNVSAPLQYLHTEQEVINILQIVFLAVALVLLISAAVLILNTIRMAIFARRREVSVMKLVGATNWFIRVPFMSEGLMQGLLGSGLAAAIVYGLHLVLDRLGNPQNPNLFTQMRLSGWEVFGTDAVVVLVGIAIGTLGSGVAIRRFLDV